MPVNVKNLPLAPQCQKRLLQITANFVRTITTTQRLKKPARHVTISDGMPATFTSFGAFKKHGMGG